jgi:hypothetical protein
MVRERDRISVRKIIYVGEVGGPVTRKGMRKRRFLAGAHSVINEPRGLICESAYVKLLGSRTAVLIAAAALAVCHCDYCDRREEGQFMTSASSVAA